MNNKKIRKAFGILALDVAAIAAGTTLIHGVQAKQSNEVAIPTSSPKNVFYTNTRPKIDPTYSIVLNPAPSRFNSPSATPNSTFSSSPSATPSPTTIATQPQTTPSPSPKVTITIVPLAPIPAPIINGVSCASPTSCPTGTPTPTGSRTPTPTPTGSRTPSPRPSRTPEKEGSRD